MDSVGEKIVFYQKTETKMNTQFILTKYLKAARETRNTINLRTAPFL